MNVEKSEAVVYIDGLGREHSALVTAVNGMNEGFITLVYVDVNAPEPDNMKKVFDVAHVSHDSKQEPNPELPSYDVNCWKFDYEMHRALPSDHPAFDHPFKEPERDEAGNPLPVARPQTEAEVKAHRDGLRMKSLADTVKEVKANAAAEAAPEAELLPPSWAGEEHSLTRVGTFLQSCGINLKGDQAVHKFLHDLKPFEARHFREDFAKWAERNPAPVALPAPPVAASESAPVNTVDTTAGGGPMPSGVNVVNPDLPSAADLDRVAEEQHAAEQTSAPEPEGPITTYFYRDAQGVRHETTNAADIVADPGNVYLGSTTMENGEVTRFSGVGARPNDQPLPIPAAEPDVTEMLDQAPPPPAEPEPPVSE